MSSSSPADAIAFVTAFCDAWASRDVGYIAGFLAPDVVWENVPIGVLNGRKAAAARIEAAFAGAYAIEWKLINIALSGEGRVLTERIDLLSMPRGIVQLRIMGIFEVGKAGIGLWRDYFDLQDYQRQLSLCGSD